MILLHNLQNLRTLPAWFVLKTIADGHRENLSTATITYFFEIKIVFWVPKSLVEKPH